MNRCLVLACFAAVSPLRAADPPDPLRALQSRTREIVESAERSVVAITVSRTPYPGQSPEDVAKGRLGDFFAVPEQRGRFGRPVIPDETRKLDLGDAGNVANNAFGSGLVLDARGFVLTNYHLVDGATKIYVRGAGGKGSYADVHAADSRSDLAVLRLLTPPAGLKPVTLAEARFHDGPKTAKATVRKGDFVFVVGNTSAAAAVDGSPSPSFGMISNVGRRALSRPVADVDRVMQPFYKLGNLIQTDARLTPGVSGGALLDLDGKVIGVTSSVAAVAGSDAAGGYAIPLDAHYRRIVATLLAGKEVEYGFLGVSTGASSSGTGVGAVLVRVTPGTPADRAGLMGGDAGMGSDSIIAIDGHPIQDMDDLFLHVGSALAGSDVTVTFRRGNEIRNVIVRLVKFRNPLPWIAAIRPPTVLGLRVDYTSVLLQDLIQAQDRQVGYTRLPEGVVIREIDPKSPAEAALKRPGDDPAKWIINRVNDTPVSTPAEFYDAAVGKEIRLHLVHTAEPGKTREVVLR